jgi:large subunit ribosomal protein L1
MANPKHGKRFRAAMELVEPERNYPPTEAVSLVKKMASAKFEETVELHLRTNADPRHAEQQVRGVTVLPHGLGKQVRILFFGQGDVGRAALDAGADFVGDDDLIARIEGGWSDFDVAIATPEIMGKIGRLGRLLGRKGLMPNPRTGTVVQPQDVGNAVSEAKKGRVELRMDRTAIIHSPIGKTGFDDDKLMDNLTAVIDTINRLRPNAIKGQFIKTAYLTTTMGPSIPLELASTLALKVD